jgi:hypothetical protein
MRDVRFIAGLIAIGAFLVSLSDAREVYAHSWYPERCCGGKDCRRVDSIEFLPDGAMLMRAGSMEVFVPSDFVQEPSPDSDAHVCAVSSGTGGYVPVCVFMPGTT